MTLDNWYGNARERVARAIQGDGFMLSLRDEKQWRAFNESYGEKYWKRHKLTNPTNGRVHVWVTRL